MSAVSLNWHPVPYDADKFLVKGTVFAQAIVPDTRSRFAIREYRARDEQNRAILRYALADANTVSDADVRNGIKPKAIAFFDEPDEAVRAAMGLLE